MGCACTKSDESVKNQGTGSKLLKKNTNGNKNHQRIPKEANHRDYEPSSSRLDNDRNNRNVLLANGNSIHNQGARIVASSRYIDYINALVRNIANIEEGAGNINLEPYLNSNHDNSFNFPEVCEDIYVGTGLKRMKGYISSISKTELIRKREEFWGTRVEGNHETWEFLKYICTNHEILDSDINAFLTAAEVKPYRSYINVTYDTKGALYEIPNYCINEPYQYNIPQIRHVTQRPALQEIYVTVRKGTSAISISTSNITTVEDFRERIGAIIKEPTARIRLFFGGKELSNQDELWNYNIVDSSVVIMMLK